MSSFRNFIGDRLAWSIFGLGYGFLLLNDSISTHRISLTFEGIGFTLMGFLWFLQPPIFRLPVISFFLKTQEAATGSKGARLGLAIGIGISMGICLFLRHR
jgi:hypothetical protein